MKKYKSVLMDADDHAKLEKLCSIHGRNMKEFTSQMIDYFERTGMNPSDEKNTNLKEAIKELRKENNRLIGFIKQQEKTKLNPILDQMAVGYRTFDKHVGKLYNLESIDERLGKILRNQQRLSDSINNPKEALKDKAQTLFVHYLNAQEWGKTIGIGKYVKDPTRLNEEYRDMFFDM